MGPVMVMAGGTGGHIFPALAVARRLMEAGTEVFWLGTPKGLESTLVPQQGIAMEWIQVEGLRGSGILRLLKAPFKLALALFQTFRVIRRRRPAAVLGMGGFASGPGGLMAWLLGVPLVVHEQNKVPGLTNQWLSRMARRVFEAFPGSFPADRSAEACGNPVRPEISGLSSPSERFAGRGETVHLLVLGGSLGAQVLNKTVPEALVDLVGEVKIQVLHQAGKRTLAEARNAYAENGVQAEIVEFIDDMADAYGRADLVVARAGALTLSELAAAGVGSILVPYPHAVDDHQTKNAAWLVDAGAALVLPQAELTAKHLRESLQPLLKNRAQLLAMAEAARNIARTDADRIVAGACLEAART